VLIVEDHPINRMVLKSQLAALGYAVQSVESGADALLAFVEHRFGLVITDCNMPDMSGYELSERIRAHERQHGQARAPIIACSANALKEEFQHCLDAGMDDYLAKPVSLPRLSEALERWLPRENSPAPETRTPQDVLTRHEPDAEAPLDLDALRVLTRGQAGATARVLGQFKRVHDRDVAALLAAVEGNNLPEVARVAHRIKGAALLIGARAVASMCAQLEDLAHAGDMMVLGDTVAQLRKHVETLDEFIRSRTT
jgi:CheY-like chemotaxis protein/HPt (histidine-containing phosphotransfer) domain-containing protein